jgi:hypothetical protein
VRFENRTASLAVPFTQVPKHLVGPGLAGRVVPRVRTFAVVPIHVLAAATGRSRRAGTRVSLRVGVGGDANKRPECKQTKENFAHDFSLRVEGCCGVVPLVGLVA